MREKRGKARVITESPIRRNMADRKGQLGGRSEKREKLSWAGWFKGLPVIEHVFEENKFKILPFQAKLRSSFLTPLGNRLQITLKFGK